MSFSIHHLVMPICPPARNAAIKSGGSFGSSSAARFSSTGWITRAKLPDTRSKRLDQMLDELERGGVYMNMEWKPRK